MNHTMFLRQGRGDNRVRSEAGFRRRARCSPLVVLLARRRQWLISAAAIVSAGLCVLGLSASASADATVSRTLTWEGTIEVSDRIDHEYSFTAEFGGGGGGESTTIINHSWTLPPTSGPFTEGDDLNDMFATYSPTSQSGTVEASGSGTTLCQAQPLVRREARNGTLLFSSNTPPVGWLRYDAVAGMLALDPSASGTGVFQILFPPGEIEYSSLVSACSSGPDPTPPFTVGMFTPKFLKDAEQDLRLPATREGDIIRVQGTYTFADDGDAALGGFGALIGPTANFAVLTQMGGGPVQITSSVRVDLVGRISGAEEPPPAGSGQLVIRKLTDTGDTSESFLFSQLGACVASYTLTHNQSRDPACVAPAGSPVTVLEAGTSDWKLTDISCDKGNPTVDLAARRLQISLLAAETITCTFTNTQRGAMTLRKTMNGVVDPSKSITFVLTGDGLPADGMPRSTLGDQDGVLEWPSLIPGQYKVCETPVPAGFTSFWKLDGMIVTPSNPDASGTPPEDLGNRCYDFTIAPLQERAFEVDNSHPGGDPRTIGYWKNWNRCTSGNQSSTAANNGGAAAGFFLVEDLLPQLIGDFTATRCQHAVKLLSKQDQAGKNRASDAAYELGAQLLAARFNLAAGAETCFAVQPAVLDGQMLLDGINFASSGEYLSSKSKSVRRPQALALAGTLDRYNSGSLC